MDNVKLENILSLEVEVYGGNNTNDNLSALGQLIPKNLIDQV